MTPRPRRRPCRRGSAGQEIESNRSHRSARPRSLPVPGELELQEKAFASDRAPRLPGGSRLCSRRQGPVHEGQVGAEPQRRLLHGASEIAAVVEAPDQSTPPLPAQVRVAGRGQAELRAARCPARESPRTHSMQGSAAGPSPNLPHPARKGALLIRRLRPVRRLDDQRIASSGISRLGSPSAIASVGRLRPRTPADPAPVFARSRDASSSSSSSSTQDRIGQEFLANELPKFQGPGPAGTCSASCMPGVRTRPGFGLPSSLSGAPSPSAVLDLDPVPESESPRCLGCCDRRFKVGSSPRGTISEPADRRRAPRRCRRAGSSPRTSDRRGRSRPGSRARCGR